MIIKQISLHKPELLAPAGDFSAALTAFDAGADAVYAGLSKFNARERTDNFTEEEMSKLINYAHKSGRKVYITLNTLIKENEIEEVAGLLAKLYPMNPDALIVQDIGVVKLIRDYFPAFKIHASTQMGIHNSEGVALAADMGISRVILERQLLMEEIKDIADKAKLELEVFVHGSLCCSLSGTCLFSSWIGGWSGNRGKCKQPCRRRFHQANGMSAFYFSTGDLCSIDQVKEYMRLGIASLKIEGRLKKSDYVRNTVRAYRMLLDAPPAEYDITLCKARELLNALPSRKWIMDLNSCKAFAEFIKKDEMGIPGTLSGKVAGVFRNGFKVAVSGRLHLGDRIRAQLSDETEGPALIITDMEIRGEKVKKALSGELCTIFSSKEVPEGALVYKIGESWDEMASRINSLPTAKLKFDMDISISMQGLSIKVANIKESLHWETKTPFTEAEKHPLRIEAVKEEFSSVFLEHFEAGNINVSVAGNPFIPSSVMRKLRKEFQEWASFKVKPEIFLSSLEKFHESFLQDYAALEYDPSSSLSGRSGTVAGNGDFSKDEIRSIAGEKYIRAEDIYTYENIPDEIILPEFCSETALQDLRERVSRAYAGGVRKFRIKSLYCLKLLESFRDISISASFPLPVCNSFAAAELKKFAVSKYQPWVELASEDMKELVGKSVITPEIFRFGRIPILVTRAGVSAQKIYDATKRNYDIVTNRRSGMSYLLPPEIFRNNLFEGEFPFFVSLEHASAEQSLSAFNLRKNLE